MSDQSQKLRMRPRLTLEVAPPPPEPIELTEAPAQSAEENFAVDALPLEAPPFPSASQPPFEPAISDELPPPPEPEFAAPELPAAEPEIVSYEEPPPAAEQPVRLKMALRPRVKESDLASAAPPPPPPPAMGLSASPLTEMSPATAAAMAQSGKKTKRAALIIGAVGILVFSAVGYAAYQNFIVKSRERNADFAADNAEKASKKNRKPAPAAAPVQEEKPAAGTTPDSPADETIKIDADGSPKISVSEPSLAFRAWVSGLKITGVRSGERPRLLVAQKLYATGELMSPELGITFDGYDAERHLVRFKDKNGFVLERGDR